MLGARDYRLVLTVALGLVRSVTGEDAQNLARFVDIWIGRENLMILLRESQRGRMIQILAIMSYFDDEESKAVLYDHLTHSDSYVQLAALRSLARRAEEAEYADILTHVQKMARSNAAFMADVLTQFGPKAVPFLTDLLEAQTDDNWRAATIAALGNVGDMTTALHIEQFAASISVAVRRATAQALGELQASDAADTLHKLARDENELVRRMPLSRSVRYTIISHLKCCLKPLMMKRGGSAITRRKRCCKLAKRAKPCSMPMPATKGRTPRWPVKCCSSIRGRDLLDQIYTNLGGFFLEHIFWVNLFLGAIFAIGLLQNLISAVQLPAAYAEMKQHSQAEDSETNWQLLISEEVMPMSILVPAITKS